MHFASHDVFAISGPLVISETIDDETVIIDLEKGAYYSLKSAGVLLWSKMQSPCRVSDLLQATLSHYNVEADLASTEITKLLHYMLREGLVRKNEDEPAAGVEAQSSNQSLSRAPFVAPAIQKFTDMEAMLLLDPIHDADEEGWPNLPAGDKIPDTA
jgi:hypothetical protein